MRAVILKRNQQHRHLIINKIVIFTHVNKFLPTGVNNPPMDLVTELGNHLGNSETAQTALWCYRLIRKTADSF